MSRSRSPEVPGSPERASSPKVQSPATEKASSQVVSLSESWLFSPKLPHSASMPNLPAEEGEMSPPQSKTRPQSPVERSSSRTRSPQSPTSPGSGRHSLISSPVFETRHPHKEIDQETHRFNLLASIEDVIRSAMSDKYCLAKLVFVASQSYSDPMGKFHCVIQTVADKKEVFNEQYSILKLLSIEKFVDAFNRDCKLFQLDAEQVVRGYDPNNYILSPLKPGFLNAVFVTGEDDLLGNWKQSYRMNYCEQHHAWRFTLPAGITKASYKFQLRPFSEGKTTQVDVKAYEIYKDERNNDNRVLLPLQLQQQTPRFGK